MNTDIKIKIEEEYGFKTKSIIAGPRQFVAETYILELENGTRIFAKLIKYNKYVEKTIQSLPVLEQLYKVGIKNINYPIKTTTEDYYILIDNLLIILFNYIDARQSFDFSNGKLGKLTAQIHAITPKITVPVSKEDFSLLYKEDFEEAFEKGLHPSKTEQYVLELEHMLKIHEDEIRNDWKKFYQIIDRCKNTSFDFVLTHGDATGNTLVDKNGEIYIIDWDFISLAPAERDTWFLRERNTFMDAYRSLYPQYEINELTYKFYLYNRYFEDIFGFIEEIISDKSAEHKASNLQQLKDDCFDKWLLPLIRKYV